MSDLYKLLNGNYLNNINRSCNITLLLSSRRCINPYVTFHKSASKFAILCVAYISLALDHFGNSCILNIYHVFIIVLIVLAEMEHSSTIKQGHLQNGL